MAKDKIDSILTLAKKNVACLRNYKEIEFILNKHKGTKENVQNLIAITLLEKIIDLEDEIQLLKRKLKEK